MAIRRSKIAKNPAAERRTSRGTRSTIYRLKSRMEKGRVPLLRRGEQFHEFKLRVPIRVQWREFASIFFRLRRRAVRISRTADKPLIRR